MGGIEMRIRHIYKLITWSKTFDLSRQAVSLSCSI